MASILRQEEGRLVSELESIRAMFDHAGNKGTSAEREFRDFLRRYMPGDNKVGHGEVFDIDGRTAKQTDAVVANQFHVALQADWEQPQKFTIESVQCAAEVKASLTDVESLRDCFDKAKAFKSLLVKPRQSMLLMSMGDDDRRFLQRRPYFAFAFESRITLEYMYDRLTAWDEELRQVERPVLDGLFVLSRGSLVHVGTGKGKLVVRDAEGDALTGYIGQRPSYGVLTRLLLWMYGAMPRVIQFGHPVFEYLQRPTKPGSLWLNDSGEVKRRD